jgi:hypothetical protein
LSILLTELNVWCRMPTLNEKEKTMTNFKTVLTEDEIDHIQTEYMRNYIGTPRGFARMIEQAVLAKQGGRRERALAALEIADKFCGQHTSDECPDTVHIPIQEAIHALKGMPAAAVADVKPLLVPVAWVQTGIADFIADNWAMRKYSLEEIEAGIRAIEIRPEADPQLSGNPGQVEDAHPIDWKALEARIDEFVGEYEMRGENEAGQDGCYTPTEGERAMISDAIHGLLAEAEVMRLIRPAAQAQPSGNAGSMNAADVERQYENGIHIGSGLPRATCPCGFCNRYRVPVTASKGAKP